MSKSPQWNLARFLVEHQRSFPQVSDELNALILDVASTCQRISRSVALGTLAEHHMPASGTGQVNVQGEVQIPLDVLSNELFLSMNAWHGLLAGAASEEMDDPFQIPSPFRRGEYLLVFDPLDGSSNINANVSVGSIFSVLHAPKDVIDSGRDVVEADFLQPGSEQVAAGYAIYGPTTMLMITLGHGVFGFTLHPHHGEFVLTHDSIRVPAESNEFAVNASNNRFWESPVRRYVEECLSGSNGPRSKDFNMRWIASLVAEAHRILMRGGVFMYPRDTKDPSKAGRLRLLYEANPIGMLMKEAGGGASTGRKPILSIEPESLHQRIGFVFGSQNEVQLIERYHQEVDGLKRNRQESSSARCDVR